MTQHEEACSGGGFREGFPYLHGCCVQARDRYSLRQGCCVQGRDKICDPARGGVLEGGVRGSGSPPGTAAVSKHETGTVTTQTSDARGGGAGAVSPTGTAAVSKHETVTVTKQTTGSLQFMVTFALRGEDGCYTYANMSHSLCPGRREVRPRTSKPLTYSIISYESRWPAGRVCQDGVYVHTRF